MTNSYLSGVKLSAFIRFCKKPKQVLRVLPQAATKKHCCGIAPVVLLVALAHGMALLHVHSCMRTKNTKKSGLSTLGDCGKSCFSQRLTIYLAASAPTLFESCVSLPVYWYNLLQLSFGLRCRCHNSSSMLSFFGCASPLDMELALLLVWALASNLLCVSL